MFQDMLNTITLGNSYELIKEIPDNSIDLIVTDPPYLMANSIDNKCGIFKNRDSLYTDIIKEKGLHNSINLQILDEFCRVLKTINIYIWCNKAQIKLYLDYFENKNCVFEIILWQKLNPPPLINSTYLGDKEYCLFFKGHNVHLYGNYGTKNTIYSTKLNIKDKQIYKHPTIKPLNIIKNLIINSSKENDIVLDCFSGSGTTCVAAKQLNRQFIRNRNRPRIS